MALVIDFSYIIASVLFIFGLKMLSSPITARRGNILSSLGMVIAIVATLLTKGMSYQWIFFALITGSLIGGIIAKFIKMTEMPEMVALFNGFGGLASLLVGWSEFISNPPEGKIFTAFAIYLTVLVGGVTFSGSMIAWAKLAEKISGKPHIFYGQKLVNALILLLLVVGGTMFSLFTLENYPLFISILAASLILGVLTVIPIGGADMPVVIALLNSYSGLAACAAGFVIMNNVLIVAGALVGASGLILTNIMCKGMNRTLGHVLFSGFGATQSAAAKGYQGEANPINAKDAYFILEAADSVVIAPGYGMAVAQAQHVVREFAEILERKGAQVQYAIHPVAGRMPGHMNVLLAEANVPYEQLVEPDDVNPIMPTVDVVLVVGANDVVNPAAREDESSPLYGMPIINCDLAKTCIVLKRSLNPGYAGVENPLFFKPNTRMFFGDAKTSISSLIAEFKE